MIKIGDFSKLSRISIRMLRHYDELGLLVPENVDNFTGYRYYSEAQLPVANRITSLKNMGFSLALIGEILTEYKDPKKLETYLRLKHKEIEELADNIKNQLLLLETTLSQLRKDGNMEYNVVLKELPKRKVASVRKIIPAYNEEGLLWNILMSETAPLKIQYDDPCYALAVFHDHEFKESDVDVEVQIAVKGDYKNTDNVVFKTVEPIEIASATYKGSYDKISEVNEVVANWVKDNNYNFNGFSFLIYHVSPNETQNPDELVTEVCYPVKR
jgi:DNA-binding transcriptional MerR regulator